MLSYNATIKVVYCYTGTLLLFLSLAQMLRYFIFAFLYLSPFRRSSQCFSVSVLLRLSIAPRFSHSFSEKLSCALKSFFCDYVGFIYPTFSSFVIYSSVFPSIYFSNSPFVCSLDPTVYHFFVSSTFCSTVFSCFRSFVYLSS